MKKKSERTPLPTRKQVALKRVVIAALALFCVNHFMHLGLLLPIQAVRQTEEREGAERTRVVKRAWEPELHRTHLLYLMENENTTMLSSTYLTIYGWMAGFSQALDCAKEAPLYAGQRSMSYEEGSIDYIYGRVDDSAIQRVEVLFQGETYEPVTGEPIRVTLHTLASSREEWLEKEGRVYFLLRSDESGWHQDIAPFYTALVAYDHSGDELYRIEDLAEKSFSYYG